MSDAALSVAAIALVLLVMVFLVPPALVVVEILTPLIVSLARRIHG